VPAAATPWYRDRNRQLIVAAIASRRGMIAWLLMTSPAEGEFAARSLNRPAPRRRPGTCRWPRAELQKLIQTYKGTDAASEAVITLNRCAW